MGQGARIEAALKQDSQRWRLPSDEDGRVQILTEYLQNTERELNGVLGKERSTCADGERVQKMLRRRRMVRDELALMTE